jgi:hypothetical protein
MLSLRSLAREWELSLGVVCLVVGSVWTAGGIRGTTALRPLPRNEEAALFGAHSQTASIVLDYTCAPGSSPSTCPFVGGGSCGTFTCLYACPLSQKPSGTGTSYDYTSTTETCPETQKPKCVPGTLFGCDCDTTMMIGTTTCSATQYTYYRFADICL